jgi:hypothetical protein
LLQPHGSPALEGDLAGKSEQGSGSVEQPAHRGSLERSDILINELGIVIAAAVVIGVLANLPDIKRYIRISSM